MLGPIVQIIISIKVISQDSTHKIKCACKLADNVWGAFALHVKAPCIFSEKKKNDSVFAYSMFEI